MVTCNAYNGIALNITAARATALYLQALIYKRAVVVPCKAVFYAALVKSVMADIATRT